MDACQSSDIAQQYERTAVQRIGTSKLRSYVTLIRPYQWIKNGLVLAPVLFAGKITNGRLFLESVAAALMFCATASLGYVLNDWIDRKQDAQHPTKCNRPIPSGDLGFRDILLLGALLLSVIFFFSFNFLPNLKLSLCLFAYIIMTLAYSLGLKKIACLEIFLIAFFFVLRVLAGGFATGIQISNWLFSTVFFLALLITIAKRKSEILTLGPGAVNHRKSLAQYSLPFLNHFLWAMACVSLVTYALYTVENGHNLVYSILPATYGVIRFLMLTENGKGGDPILTLIKDPHLVISTMVFLALVCYKIYVA